MSELDLFEVVERLHKLQYLQVLRGGLIKLPPVEGARNPKEVDYASVIRELPLHLLACHLHSEPAIAPDGTLASKPLGPLTHVPLSCTDSTQYLQWGLELLYKLWGSPCRRLRTGEAGGHKGGNVGVVKRLAMMVLMHVAGPGGGHGVAAAREKNSFHKALSLATIVPATLEVLNCACGDVGAGVRRPATIQKTVQSIIFFEKPHLIINPMFDAVATILKMVRAALISQDEIESADVRMLADQAGLSMIFIAYLCKLPMMLNYITNTDAKVAVMRMLVAGIGLLEDPVMLPFMEDGEDSTKRIVLTSHGKAGVELLVARCLALITQLCEPSRDGRPHFLDVAFACPQSQGLCQTFVQAVLALARPLLSRPPLRDACVWGGEAQLTLNMLRVLVAMGDDRDLKEQVTEQLTDVLAGILLMEEESFKDRWCGGEEAQQLLLQDPEQLLTVGSLSDDMEATYRKLRKAATGLSICSPLHKPPGDEGRLQDAKRYAIEQAVLLSQLLGELESFDPSLPTNMEGAFAKLLLVVSNELVGSGTEFVDGMARMFGNLQSLCTFLLPLGAFPDNEDPLVTRNEFTLLENLRVRLKVGALYMGEHGADAVAAADLGGILYDDGSESSEDLQQSEVTGPATTIKGVNQAAPSEQIRPVPAPDDAPIITASAPSNEPTVATQAQCRIHSGAAREPGALQRSGQSTRCRGNPCVQQQLPPKETSSLEVLQAGLAEGQTQGKIQKQTFGDVSQHRTGEAQAARPGVGQSCQMHGRRSQTAGQSWVQDQLLNSSVSRQQGLTSHQTRRLQDGRLVSGQVGRVGNACSHDGQQRQLQASGHPQGVVASRQGAMLQASGAAGAGAAVMAKPAGRVSPMPVSGGRVVGCTPGHVSTGNLQAPSLQARHSSPAMVQGYQVDQRAAQAGHRGTGTGSIQEVLAVQQASFDGPHRSGGTAVQRTAGLAGMPSSSWAQNHVPLRQGSGGQAAGIPRRLQGQMVPTRTSSVMEGRQLSAEEQARWYMQPLQQTMPMRSAGPPLSNLGHLPSQATVPPGPSYAGTRLPSGQSGQIANTVANFHPQTAWSSLLEGPVLDSVAGLVSREDINAAVEKAQEAGLKEARRVACEELRKRSHANCALGRQGSSAGQAASGYRTFIDPRSLQALGVGQGPAQQAAQMANLVPSQDAMVVGQKRQRVVQGQPVAAAGHGSAAMYNSVHSSASAHMSIGQLPGTMPQHLQQMQGPLSWPVQNAVPVQGERHSGTYYQQQLPNAQAQVPQSAMYAQNRLAQGQMAHAQLPQAQMAHAQLPSAQMAQPRLLQAQTCQPQISQIQMVPAQMAQPQTPQGHLPQVQMPQGQADQDEMVQGQMPPYSVHHARAPQIGVAQVQRSQAAMRQSQVRAAQVPEAEMRMASMNPPATNPSPQVQEHQVPQPALDQQAALAQQRPLVKSEPQDTGTALGMPQQPVGAIPSEQPAVDNGAVLGEQQPQEQSADPPSEQPATSPATSEPKRKPNAAFSASFMMAMKSRRSEGRLPRAQ